APGPPSLPTRRSSDLLAIREDHSPETLARHGEAENSVVAIDLASGDVEVLAFGADFYSNPRVSPDGRRMSWLRWNHPNLPWDGRSEEHTSELQSPDHL